MSDNTRSCAVCGCTETTPCDDQRGPCWWASDRLCSHCQQPDWRRAMAAIAAQQAIEASAELLRFAREGEALGGLFMSEATEQLADAARMAAMIEQDGNSDEERGQMIAALEKFLEGWA